MKLLLCLKPSMLWFILNIAQPFRFSALIMVANMSITNFKFISLNMALFMRLHAHKHINKTVSSSRRTCIFSRLLAHFFSVLICQIVFTRCHIYYSLSPQPDALQVLEFSDPLPCFVHPCVTTHGTDASSLDIWLCGIYTPS